MPYKWATLTIYQTPCLSIHYDRKRSGDDPFNIPLTVELARRYDITECWINKLTLYIENQAYGNTFYEFRNRPITPGSDAEKFIFNWYQTQRRTGWIKKIPHRHLPLTSAKVQVSHKKAHLDPSTLSDSSFISWLHSQTYGLVHIKTRRKMVGDRFIDVNIETIKK